MNSTNILDELEVDPETPDTDNTKTVEAGPDVLIVDPKTNVIKYATTTFVHFSRGRASRKLNTYTNIALLLAVLFITAARCLTDPHICDAHHSDGESTTLSFIIDKSWMAMFAMAIFTLGCVLHIFMAWWVYFPNEPFVWHEIKRENIFTAVTVIRALHTVVFFHGFLVGIFRVGEEPRVHYGVATVMFSAAGIETLFILYRSWILRPHATSTFVQVIVWLTLTCSFITYLVTEIGWFELGTLALLPIFYLFLNYDMGSDAEVECVVKIPEKPKLLGAAWRLYMPRSLYRIKQNSFIR
tara:strand:- start:2505 stop:3398 length:894 start_codon:yes stop_codon:yes gene_type:complete